MRSFRVLLAEAIRDGLRRRLAWIVTVLLVIGLAGAQNCTGFGSGDFIVNGKGIESRVAAGFIAPLLFALQALAVLAMAGMLGAEHLARPLADGSAALWLARPVSREQWALARLAGVLGIALAAGVLLLGGTSALLVARQGVSVEPALLGAAATAIGVLIVASLTMVASLSFGRSAVMLLMVSGLVLVVVANSLGMAADILHPDRPLGGFLGSVDRFGPPLFAAIVASTAAWNPHIEAGVAFTGTMSRLALWAVASVSLLLVIFRRRDLDG